MVERVNANNGQALSTSSSPGEASASSDPVQLPDLVTLSEDENHLRKPDAIDATELQALLQGARHYAGDLMVPSRWAVFLQFCRQLPGSISNTVRLTWTRARDLGLIVLYRATGQRGALSRELAARELLPTLKSCLFQIGSAMLTPSFRTPLELVEFVQGLSSSLDGWHRSAGSRMSNVAKRLGTEEGLAVFRAIVPVFERCFFEFLLHSQQWNAELAQALEQGKAVGDAKIAQHREQFHLKCVVPLRAMGTIFNGLDTVTTELAPFWNVRSEGVRHQFSLLVQEVVDLMHNVMHFTDALEREMSFLDVHFSEKSPCSVPQLQGLLKQFKREGFETVPQILRYVAATHACRAFTRRTRVVSGDAPELPIPAEKRYDLLRILNELTLNAVRHSDLHKSDRQVRLDASVINGQLVFSVSDNGEGIEHPELHLRVPTNPNVPHAGLAIVKSLAERNQWNVRMTSIKGEGTSVLVGIDLAAWAARSTPTAVLPLATTVALTPGMMVRRTV